MNLLIEKYGFICDSFELVKNGFDCDVGYMGVRADFAIQRKEARNIALSCFDLVFTCDNCGGEYFIGLIARIRNNYFYNYYCHSCVIKEDMKHKIKKTYKYMERAGLCRDVCFNIHSYL